MSGPTRVNVCDGVTGDEVHHGILLVDAMADAQDELEHARRELQLAGRYWIGGGAAPLFILLLCRE